MPFNKMKKSAWILKCSYGNYNSLEIFDLNYGVNYIGRSKNNSIILENDTISRYHCQLVIENNDIPIIKDVGSKNGTTVQALKLEGVEDCILKENDSIYLSNNEKRVLLKICKKVNTINENIDLSKVDNLSEHINLLDNKATKETDIQETNVSDIIISQNKNNSEYQLIIEKNEKVKDENFLLKREQLASKWAQSYLQKCMNNNSDDDKECATSQNLFIQDGNNIDQKLSTDNGGHGY